MACKHAFKTRMIQDESDQTPVKLSDSVTAPEVGRLLFGVDSNSPSDNLLQNNIDQFEWVNRNKIYPNFWGRNINGENSLTKKEIQFLHDKGCKIAAIYITSDSKQTEEQGALLAKKVDLAAFELKIPEDTAIFLELGDGEIVTTAFMRGFAKVLMAEGYTPGFKANTDASFDFDREFSRGLQTDRDVFSRCLIWAVSPSLAEYDRVTTTHLIHPDNWIPFAPSGITRNEIAVWQYGKNCHPICDDSGKEVTFNVNLVRNEKVIIDKMF